MHLWFPLQTREVIYFRQSLWKNGVPEKQGEGMPLHWLLVWAVPAASRAELQCLAARLPCLLRALDAQW